jgi:hypothetical protein
MAASHPKAAGRYAALEQIYKARGIEKDVAKMKPFLLALDAKETFLVSGALFRVKSKAARSGIKDDLNKKALGLITHEDPGIRGRSAEVLAAIAGFDKEKQKVAAAQIMPLLADDNPFTKSAAANALAWIKHKPAIHKIIEMVGDTTKNTYDITGWKTLEGHGGRIHHDGSAWSRVGDAALYSLKMLSATTKERFDYKVNSKKVDADLEKAAVDAKAWYARVKADVPKE